MLFIARQQEAAGAHGRPEHRRGVRRVHRGPDHHADHGHRGLKWTPYLATMFFFIFFSNIFEIIPVFQMPANARIALPMFLALLTW